MRYCPLVAIDAMRSFKDRLGSTVIVAVGKCKDRKFPVGSGGFLQALLELRHDLHGRSAAHVLRRPVAGYSSFGSVIRSNALGSPSFIGGVHQSRCSS